MKPLQLRIDADQADVIVDALHHAAVCATVARPTDEYEKLAQWLSYRRTKTYGKRPPVGTNSTGPILWDGIPATIQVSDAAKRKANELAAKEHRPVPYQENWPRRA